MPLYEFECQRCGGFTLSRPMAESALPAPCQCGAQAERVLSATGIRTGAGRRSRPGEPTLVSTRNREPEKPKQAAGHGRPWMLGH